MKKALIPEVNEYQSPSKDEKVFLLKKVVFMRNIERGLKRKVVKMEKLIIESFGPKTPNLITATQSLTSLLVTVYMRYANLQET